MLVTSDPTAAWRVTWPRKTDFTELKKLDFPDPTGPSKRILITETKSAQGV